MTELEAVKPKNKKISPAEKIFLEDCQTKCVSPIVLETFRNAKIVSERSRSRGVLHLSSDQYKNMIQHVTEFSYRYRGGNTPRGKQKRSV